MRQRVCWVLLMVLLMFPLGSNLVMAQAIRRGGTLNAIVKEDMLNLNPVVDGGFEGEMVDDQISDSLVNVGPHGETVPGLATSWAVAADAVTYTFRLRQGVTFHDGTPFDAEVVKFNWDRMLDPKVGYAARQYSNLIKSVRVVDKYTIEVVTPRPNADFIDSLTTDDEVRMHSPTAIQKWGKDYGSKAAVGTGPFKFVEWVPDQRIVLERNDHYWKPGLPYLDRIIYRPTPEESLRMIFLRARRADVVFEPSLADAKRLTKDSRFVVVSAPGSTLNFMYFNTCKAPFNDIRVRQALSYGVDRKAIAEAVFLGFAEPASGIFPSWHPAYDKQWEGTIYPYDPIKAKDMLNQAGFNDAHPLSFSLHTTNVSEYVDEVQLVQNQLAKIGVKVTPNVVEKAALAGLWNPPQGQNPTFDVGLYRLKFGKLTKQYTWSSYSADAPFELTWYNRACGYKNQEMPPLLDNALTTLDRQQAVAVDRQISAIAIHDAPRILLSWGKNVNIIQSYVRGMGMDVQNWFPLETIWLAK